MRINCKYCRQDFSPSFDQRNCPTCKRKPYPDFFSAALNEAQNYNLNNDIDVGWLAGIMEEYYDKGKRDQYDGRE